VTPIIKNNKTELDELQSKFTRNDGSPLQQEVRQMLQETPAYKNLKINTQRWSTDASDELKRYISKKEQQISKTKSSPATLTDITKTYLFMTELFPSEDLMIKALEDYNLSAFPINREGKPKHVLTALALSLNLTDKDGNLDATRIPTYAISATLSHVNWKGNGKTALKDAQELRRKKLPNPNDHLKPMVSNWVTGKGRRYGIDEMAKLNILTEDIIYQYQEIEMPGAKNLALKYHNAVQEKEAELFKKQSLNPKESTTVCVDETKDTTSKTFLVALKDFIQLR
ncbi:MAG: hypothetical protein IKW39_01045, partial [Alphaproteobacteria bacterium]|nr:hypothetical protein [Alphaproteobacteria bacterium]